MAAEEQGADGGHGGQGVDGDRVETQSFGSLAEFEASMPRHVRDRFRDAQMVYAKPPSRPPPPAPQTPQAPQACSASPRAATAKRHENNGPALWLGGAWSARDAATLRARGTTHILACNGRRPPPWLFVGGPVTSVLVIDWDDNETEDLLLELPRALAWLDAALDAGRSVLVHCTAGVSRSSAVIVAFFISRLGMSYDAALARVRAARPWARPNPGFERQLLRFEAVQRGCDPRFCARGGDDDDKEEGGGSGGGAEGGQDGDGKDRGDGGGGGNVEHEDEDVNEKEELATASPGVCQLCRLDRTTEWFVEETDFVVIECDQCDQPMAVWRRHTMEISEASAAAMEAALRGVADARLGAGNYYVDKKQRSITTHLHWHARAGQDPWAKMRELAGKL